MSSLQMQPPPISRRLSSKVMVGMTECQQKSKSSNFSACVWNSKVVLFFCLNSIPGSPCEYQSIRMNEKELSSDFPLANNSRVQLSLTLDGGSPHFSAGSFVCYFRCMCCFSGIDGDWKSCQWFCFKVCICFSSLPKFFRYLNSPLLFPSLSILLERVRGRPGGCSVLFSAPLRFY